MPQSHFYLKFLYVPQTWRRPADLAVVVGSPLESACSCTPRACSPPYTSSRCNFWYHAVWWSPWWCTAPALGQTATSQHISMPASHTWRVLFSRRTSVHWVRDFRGDVLSHNGLWRRWVGVISSHLPCILGGFKGMIDSLPGSAPEGEVSKIILLKYEVPVLMMILRCSLVSLP